MKKLPATMKCLVVDDEPLAAGLICSYVETVSELELAGTCHSALDALTLLRQQPIDLIFLDIQMPRLTGLEFLRTLSHPPAVIITTAYREYAVEGFELDVVDYLVKPVTLERFLKAVGKVIHRQQQTPIPAQGFTEAAYVYYKVDRQMIKVYLQDVCWIESLKDYIRIVLKDGRNLITYQRISYAEEKLPSALFLRIHRSYIVARNQITSYDAQTVSLCQQKIPIGKSYKQHVQQELSR